MKKLLLFFIPLFVLTSFTLSEDWGFFGHRRINRMAVFTLPQDMLVFYKRNIEFITEHAVDPDKRRYATKHEAVRHYIDIDHWGTYPYENIPRAWEDMLVKFTDIYLVTQERDTLVFTYPKIFTAEEEELTTEQLAIKQELGKKELETLYKEYKTFYIKNIQPQYYEDHWKVDLDQLATLFPEELLKDKYRKAYAIDHFSEYGIIPYHLVQMQNRLTRAFEEKNVNRILRLSAEMGHYIGDAHVPLHTTENYNGQMTNQVGIHAFWESRIPELFADKTYDYFVGKADYISDPQTFYWDVVLESHTYLDSLLAIEKELSITFPSDKQYCQELRLGRQVRTQCQEYTAAYHNRLKGQVEYRMRGAIHTIGCSWYTAWIDAGQPDLSLLGTAELSEKEQKALKEEEANFKEGKIKGRNHDDF